MIRYKVTRPFTDYGMHHAVGEIISDASFITNLEVRIWEGCLTAIDDSGKELPKKTKAKSDVDKSKENTIPTPPVKKTATVTTTAKVATPKTVTKTVSTTTSVK